ncbi:hypothetical protein [Paracoccus kondratievae]|uniref:hypothetical protein n=1 Tax=Paracoccus kondratievae TaxID=135740 RepID=UPI0022F289CF|nr:hypothetical protein [Paracoccus kondratievae]
MNGNWVSTMSNGFNDSGRELISEPLPSLISDQDWQALVDLHLGPAQRQQWYSEGYRDGQYDALREAAAVVAKFAADIPEGEARQVMTGLASFLSILAPEEIQEAEAPNPIVAS